MTALYNEIDLYAAKWIENLVAAGHVAPGRVDARSIKEITAADLAGVVQFHAFAGIAVWSHALRRAGWPDEFPVWTGSCPCQPFSDAGAGAGFADERHLWPDWFKLIDAHRPPVVFGEQVASKDGLAWFDLVRTDLEGAGYAVGVLDSCAAGYGAPHIRQRLYFVGIRVGTGTGWVVHAIGARLEGLAGHGDGGGESRRVCADEIGPTAAPGPTGGWWARVDWLLCRDQPVNKWRPVEPGTFPLAHGAASRVGRLRAYGNGLAAPQATEFVVAVMDFIDALLGGTP